ncbi:putative ferric-chelate reductase 1 [Kryptolebias marmoratus]|uniref:putative ferric-chelate reductase 1 n=1 Tax=Kryptolebias marmoratus TaxID=37003 RepID=UPI0007F8B82E|nr:putative ferric-chelate reductase 1 [Kryptolebias marmoratus]
MERSAILFFTTLMVLTTGVQSQLTFATNSTQVDITRTGCGSSKLCEEVPKGCDPAGNSACLFVSTALKNQTANNGAEVSFQLSGNSTGYIAAGITPNANTGSTLLFVCTNNDTINEKFFRMMLRNNTDNMLSPHNTTVREIRGQVNGDKIQCEFDVPNLNATSSSFLRAGADTTFFILLGTGKLNTDGSLGTFNVNRTSDALDLTNPMANVANTTAVPTNTTGAADRALHSGGALLLMSVLSLSALTAA